MTTDIQHKLRLLRMKDPRARALFDCFLTYAKFMTMMTVETLAKKSNLREKEVRDVLQVLQRLKLGRFIVGRRGEESRFEWVESYFGVIPGKQLGEEPDLDPLAALNIKGIGGAMATPLNEWVIALGGRRTATVLLPPNTQRTDVLKLQDFFDQYLKALKDS